MIDNVSSWILGTILVLLGAFVWELSDDAHGDFNKRGDVRARAVIMFLTSSLNALLNGKTAAGMVMLFFISLNASVAWFFMFFDYTIAYILIKNKVVGLKNVHWFSYLGKVGQVDNWRPWRNLTQWQRFWIRIGYFLASMLIYILYAVNA